MEPFCHFVRNRRVKLLPFLCAYCVQQDCGAVHETLSRPLDHRIDAVVERTTTDGVRHREVILITVDSTAMFLPSRTLQRADNQAVGLFHKR